MRRFLLFILAVLYFGVSSGLALNCHYCIGKLAEVSLLYLDTCSNCGEAGTSHRRCSTETEYIKLFVDQDMADTLVQLSAPIVVVLLFDLLDSYRIAERDETACSNPFINSPEEDSATPLFVRHCIFLVQRYRLPFQEVIYVCLRTSTGVIYCEYWDNPSQVLE